MGVGVGVGVGVGTGVGSAAGTAGAGEAEVLTVRKAEDTEKLRKKTLRARSAIVVGGGFIGLEIAWQLKELGLYDSFSVLAYYMYGAMYGIFSGKEPEKVIVNFYNANGDLIETADSSNME